VGIVAGRPSSSNAAVVGWSTRDGRATGSIVNPAGTLRVRSPSLNSPARPGTRLDPIKVSMQAATASRISLHSDTDICIEMIPIKQALFEDRPS